MSALRRALIYGGKGALGSACVNLLKAYKFWISSVDYSENIFADHNVTVKKGDDIFQQQNEVLKSLGQVLSGAKLDAVVCVATDWQLGTAKDKFAEACVGEWNHDLIPAIISTTVAVNHLTEGGLIAFCGAKIALEPSPKMMALGMFKAAIHQLTQSLSDQSAGLPKSAVAICILPDVLDSPNARGYLSDKDTSSWTKPDYVASLVLKWIMSKKKPDSGSLLQLLTDQRETHVIPVQKITPIRLKDL